MPYFDSAIINFYLNPDSVKNANKIELSTRKRYTEKTKREMREHYLLTENYVATAKAFNVNESTLRNIVKTFPRNVKLTDKGNRLGAGRSLTYPLEVENDLVCWILKLRYAFSTICACFKGEGKKFYLPSQSHIQC